MMQDKVKVYADELIALLEAVLNDAPDRFLRARQMQYSLFRPILKNCPPDAEYYTSGEIRRYWKVDEYQANQYWWIWSQMLDKWIPMYYVKSGDPKNLVEIEDRQRPV